MKENPELFEKIYSEIINQPRSKLKLPIKELIKINPETNNLNTFNSASGALQLKSKADLWLDRLRSDSGQVIPRLETINEISKEFAIEGNWEKAEALILNMKQDCI